MQNEVEALQERIDELEKEASTYRDALNFILEELYKICEEAGIESYGIDIILNVLRGNNKALKTKEVKGLMGIKFYCDYCGCEIGELKIGK